MGSSPGTVPIWQLDLGDPAWDVAEVAQCLSVAEHARADRGTSAVRRRRVLVRGGLRRVLGSLLGRRAADVPLLEDRGRPYLAPSDAGPQVSCSASGDVALIAVAEAGRIGIDVERHDTGAAAAADEDWLTATELAALSGLSGSDLVVATTRCWTQKEAVLKASGLGLTRSPATVGTPVGTPARIDGWWVTDVPVRAGHVASLARETFPPPHEPELLVLTPGATT